MAHKKGSGSTKNGRDSNSKRLGVKRYAGEWVYPGDIIIRQRGMTFLPGEYVKMGKDFTLYATKDGQLKYRQVSKTKKEVLIIPAP